MSANTKNGSGNTIEISDDPASWERALNILRDEISHTPTNGADDARGVFEVLGVLSDIQMWAHMRRPAI